MKSIEQLDGVECPYVSDGVVLVVGQYPRKKSLKYSPSHNRNRMKVPLHVALLLALLAGTIASTSNPISAFADTRVVFHDYWNCPTTAADAPAPSSDKDGDGKLDRKYVHIVDSNGNDFQVWCLDHGPGGDYAFYSSKPGEPDRYISGCLLHCGTNSGTFTINGTGPTEQPRVNGTKQFTVNGTLTGYNHTNWVPPDHPTSTDKGKDYHFFYNYTTHEHWKMTTQINATTGKHEIIKAEKLTLLPGTDRTTMDGELAFIAESFPDLAGSTEGMTAAVVPAIFMVSAADIRVTFPTDEALDFRLFYPSQLTVNKFTFDGESKTLILSLPLEHQDYFNIAIPRDLLDHGAEEQFTVLIDDREVEHSEGTTDSYRVISLDLEPTDRQIVITGTYAAPEFGGVAMFIIVAALIAIAMLAVRLKSGSPWRLKS